MQLNHLHLHVADVNRARAFYQNYFAMREHVWHGPILFMRDSADMDLALAPAASIEPLPDWFHFGFRQSAAADVEALHDKMSAAGLAPGALAREPDYVTSRCRDPDGYRIEIYWEE